MSVVCWKCGHESGDDWRQCESRCPQACSPYYDQALKQPRLLCLSALRRANMLRLPHFRNRHGQPVHLLDGSDWSIADWMLAVTGELGEISNELKAVRKGERTLDEARSRIADEFADVLCYLDIAAMRCGVDLGAAVIEKFNKVSRRIGAEVFLSSTGEIELGACDLLCGFEDVDDA